MSSNWRHNAVGLEDEKQREAQVAVTVDSAQRLPEVISEIFRLALHQFSTPIECGASK